jgi:hypothetical protein
MQTTLLIYIGFILNFKCECKQEIFRTDSDQSTVVLKSTHHILITNGNIERGGSIFFFDKIFGPLFCGPIQAKTR